jgi:predicted outer membrane protein
MVTKSLLAGTAILLGSACYVAAQQPGTNQGSSGVGSTQNDPTQGASSGTSQSTTPQTAAPQVGGAIDQQPVDPTSATGRRAGRVGHDLDHYITDCLINGNQEEIALARIAVQRATDPQVKQFAQEMIRVHSTFLNKLQTDSGRASGSTNGQPALNQQIGEQQQSNPQFNGAQASGERTAAGGQGVDLAVPGARVTVGRSDGSHMGHDAARQFLQVEKEVHQQCLQSKTRELSQKEGAQFDRCYMNSQVAAHMKMADELTVYSRKVSSSLQTTLQEGLQTTQQHLAHAKQIAERLDGATPRSASNNNQNPSQQ